MITTIILAHYKERERHLKTIVNDLMSGTVKPKQIKIKAKSMIEAGK